VSVDNVMARGNQVPYDESIQLAPAMPGEPVDHVLT
jgi:hypothetical protein